MEFCSKIGEYKILDNDIKDAKQFIFCLEVFIELGFFEIENGVLIKGKNTNNPLTNSKIYNKVRQINGGV